MLTSTTRLARGLSSPGPRMMVESLLAKERPRLIRVVVSSRDAADDLSKYFEQMGAEIRVDSVGEEFHILANLDDLDAKADGNS